MASMCDNFSSFAEYFPAVAAVERSTFQTVYDENRHRVYALSFWMTDNEITAEELMTYAFRRAFATSNHPSAETIDVALVEELRELMPIGTLTLECAACDKVENVRRNTLRVHLERAVVQLPATEKMIFLLHDVEGYSHARIARYLDLTEEECQRGLHQARLRIRELLARMVS